MLNFINKKGEKVMEMKDDGSLKIISESLDIAGVEKTTEDKSDKKDDEHGTDK